MKEATAHAVRPGMLYALAGGFGGYTYGITIGILDGLDLELAIGLGGHLLISGALTGAIGAFVFRMINGEGIGKTVLKIGILGMLFFGFQSIIAPGYATDIPFQDEPLLAFVGGFLGGCFGGIVMWVFRKIAASP